jgi:hypothetical protein
VRLSIWLLLILTVTGRLSAQEDDACRRAVARAEAAARRAESSLQRARISELRVQAERRRAGLHASQLAALTAGMDGARVQLIRNPIALDAALRRAADSVVSATSAAILAEQFASTATAGALFGNERSGQLQEAYSFPAPWERVLAQWAGNHAGPSQSNSHVQRCGEYAMDAEAQAFRAEQAAQRAEIAAAQAETEATQRRGTGGRL